MLERIDEGTIKEAIDFVTIKQTEEILNQMKNSICKIKGKSTGTGFFCYINYEDTDIPCLITNYHVLDDNFIKQRKKVGISMDDNDKIGDIFINEKDILYLSPKNEYDTIIIKLKKIEKHINFLQLDDKLFNKNSEKGYESIYILHYPNGANASVSYGKGIKFVSDDNKYNIEHKCNTLPGSSGGPILNLSTLKVIGLHKGTIKINNETQFNISTLLKFPLIELKNRKKVCEITIGKEHCIGFFSKIPFPDLNNMLSVLITNNHIINKKLLFKDNTIIEINIEKETNIKKLNLNNRMKYTNEEFNITIIEIKNEDEINNYFELDDNIINDIINNINKNENYIDEIIYIIQYLKGKLSILYGKLDNINEDKKYNFNQKYSIEFESSGSPIININNKLIGIHKEGYNNENNKGIFLNFPIKEYIQLYCNNDELLLQEFNIKYNLNIENYIITELELSHKKIGDKGLKALCKIEFKKLKKLYLNDNNISDIKVLEKAKFEQLEILNLKYNKISDINILEKVKFKKLQILNLGYNNISDINILEKVKFKEIKELYLNNNNIYNIEVFKKTKFIKLEISNLRGNEILDTDLLENINFKESKEIFLFDDYLNNVNYWKPEDKQNYDIMKEILKDLD